MDEHDFISQKLLQYRIPFIWLGFSGKSNGRILSSLLRVNGNQWKTILSAHNIPASFKTILHKDSLSDLSYCNEYFSYIVIRDLPAGVDSSQFEKKQWKHGWI